MRPQPATGQKEEEPSPQKVDSQRAGNTSLPHPIQQLANTYNEAKRPLPTVKVTPKENNSPQLPTIINNYYYVQAPPSDLPVMPPYVDPQQHFQNSVLKSQSPPLQQPPPPSQQQTQQAILSQYHHHHKNQNESVQYRNSCRTSSPQKYQVPVSPIESSDDTWEYKEKSDVKRSPRREVSATSTFSNDRHQHRLHTHRKSPSRVNSSDSTTSESTLNTQNAYDSFVKRSTKTHSSSRSSPLKKESLIDNLYQRESIYSSASISDSSRNKLPLEEGDTVVARIPIVEATYPDTELLSNELADINFHDERSLIKELMKLEDDEISVHSDKVFRFFSQCCFSSSSMTIEQLGSILYDPYHPNTRLSFKTLSILLDTFSSNTKTDEIDFRSFVKMCKFVKGCYVSFNYHDKRGNDHVLDFDEFQLALRSNRIVCSDRLLAEIFEHSETLDFEQYLVAIILIRKSEKSKH